MRDFRELNIWKESMELVKRVYGIARKLPKEELFGLASQMHRAAVSIPSNIAGGCSRTSEVDFKRFLEMAVGSSFELETQLLLVTELYPTLDKSEIMNLISDFQTLQKQINSFINAIKKRLNE